jgi:2,3-bisphosphoglycerate-independent phosphoglycerate mutase
MMLGMEVLEIPGVTDGTDNDYVAQAIGAMKSLEEHDMAVIHVESPDEAGHTGSIEGKVAAIEAVDREILGRFISMQEDLRVLVAPDHPTPIETRTHSSEPVPFLIWGPGIEPNGAARFTEVEAARTNLLINDGYTIMTKLIKG